MEVDFSQIGQNVAAQVATQTTLRNDVQKEQEAETAQRAVEQIGQGNAQTADNNGNEEQASVDIETAVAEISEFVQAQNRQLSFSIDEDSRRSVVRVTDSESGEVIRQIPSEEVLALSERIKELQSDVGAAVGVLFNRQA